MEKFNQILILIHDSQTSSGGGMTDGSFSYLLLSAVLFPLDCPFLGNTDTAVSTMLTRSLQDNGGSFTSFLYLEGLVS
jgi:hypothetical protein